MSATNTSSTSSIPSTSSTLSTPSVIEQRAFIFILSKTEPPSFVALENTDVNGKTLWMTKIAEWTLPEGQIANVCRVGFSQSKAKYFLSQTNSMMVGPDMIHIVDAKTQEMIAYIWKPIRLPHNTVEVCITSSKKTSLVETDFAIEYIAKLLNRESEKRESTFDFHTNFYPAEKNPQTFDL